MISKEDVKNYLEKMLKIERDMESKYIKLSKQVNDKEIKKAFEQLVKDENDHAKMVTELQNLLKNWK